MNSQSLVRSCAGAILFVVLVSNLSRAQTTQTPHDALLDLYFSDTPEAAERHLLNSTKEQLAQLDPSARQVFFDMLMVRQDMEKEGGVVSKRGGQDHAILTLEAKDQAQSMNVTLDKEEINGDGAVVETALHRNGAENLLVTFRMKKEEGQWRLAGVEPKPGPNDNFFMSQLDSPRFAEKLKEFAVAGKMNANHASAVGCIRTINTAEVTYASTYPKGFSPDLKSLGGNGANSTESAAGLIDESLASGKKSGFIFTYTAGPKDKNGVIGTYSVVARPDTYGKTGKWSFFTDQSAVIRGTQEDRAATVDDPPLQ